MIPRLGKSGGTGASFKGAGLYYLHDKQQMTQERIGETHVINMHTADPETAIRVMAATAMNQKELKVAAGEKATGRKLTKPVFTYSLSWHPDDKPTAAHMVEQAKDSLATLGLEGKQALIVQHCDTNHPHVHVIVNRVDPTNGIAAPLKYTKETLSRWAAAYEENHGIRCEGRARSANEKQHEQTEQPPAISNDNVPLAAPEPCPPAIDAEQAEQVAFAAVVAPKETAAPSEVTEGVASEQTVSKARYSEVIQAEPEQVKWSALPDTTHIDKPDLPEGERSHSQRVTSMVKNMAQWLQDKTQKAWLYLQERAQSTQQQQTDQPQQNYRHYR